MITTSRTEFLGAHVTPEIKKKIEQEASSRGMTVSMFVYAHFAEQYGYKVEGDKKKRSRQ